MLPLTFVVRTLADYYCYTALGCCTEMMCYYYWQYQTFHNSCQNDSSCYVAPPFSYIIVDTINSNMQSLMMLLSQSFTIAVAGTHILLLPLLA